MTEDDRRLRWVFEPYVPVRPDVAMECIFLRKWQQLMGGASQNNDMWCIENEGGRFAFLELFRDLMHVPGERETRVATSFIRWVGTGNGHGYLHTAERLAAAMDKGGYSREDAYLAAWALENKRCFNVGYNRVPRGTLMGDETPTTKDFEIMELTARWLGSETGQAFIADAQGAVSARLRADRDARMKEQAGRLRPQMK